MVCGRETYMESLIFIRVINLGPLPISFSDFLIRGFRRDMKQCIKLPIGRSFLLFLHLVLLLLSSSYSYSSYSSSTLSVFKASQKVAFSAVKFLVSTMEAYLEGFCGLLGVLGVSVRLSGRVGPLLHCSSTVLRRIHLGLTNLRR